MTPGTFRWSVLLLPDIAVAQKHVWKGEGRTGGTVRKDPLFEVPDL